MPMKTRCVACSTAFARRTWPRISPAVRLRASPMVPVRQNAQAYPQPTCVDRQSVTRPSSGITTLDPRQRGDGPLGEGRPELLRQVGHRVEVDDALAIDPRGELAPAIARGAKLHREVLQLGGQHSDEVRGGHRTKNNTVIAL